MTDFNGPRDVPALWGLAKTAPYFWDGSIGTLNAAILRPVKGHMKRFVSGDCANSNTDECNTAAATLVAQLVAYVKTLDPPATAFDEGKLSDAALRGEKIFQGKGGCIECHGGPLFTDNLTHNTAVPQVRFESPYRAAADDPVTSNDKGAPAAAARGRLHRHPAARRLRRRRPPPARRSSTPRSCATSRTPAPYMHNGVVPDARAGRRLLQRPVPAGEAPPVCASASAPAPCTVPLPLANDPTPAVPKSNLSPLNLTDGEMQDLVAYLESL